MKSGIVIINKPAGYTSQDVVSKVKKILNVKKAGHTGTLDPLATGVLPILIGDATKLSKYLIEHDKSYIATLKMGVKTETGDEEGKIVEEIQVQLPEIKKIEGVINSFEGKQKQKPHKFSAVKINGKKLYEYAREGIEVEIPSRDIEIYKIKVLDISNENNEIKIEVSCSKGTYIRVLCEEIAEKLGAIGYMKQLQRVQVDEFDIKDSVKLENLNEKDIITVQEICESKYKKIVLNNRKLELFLNGVILTFEEDDGIYNIYNDNKFVGLGIIKNSLLKRDIVIND